MKKIIIALIVGFLIIPGVYAQEEATDSATPTKESNEGLDNTIKSLKEKIENKVEEINKETKHIVHGIIASVESDSIELTTESDNTFIVSLDDTISTYFSTSVEGKEEIEQGDLEEGDYLVVSGPILEDQVSANVVYRQTRYAVLQGQITATDDTNFTVDVVTSEKDEYTIDIEDDTVQQIMNTKTFALETGGFSKYKVGDSIHFVIVDSDESTVAAIRTLIIPQEFFVDTTPDEEEATETSESDESENSEVEE